MTVSGRGSDKRRLRVIRASGERATLGEMLRNSPARVNLRWKAEGLLFDVSPEEVVNLMAGLERQLHYHGFTHAQARVYGPPPEPGIAHAGAKPAVGRARSRKEPGLWLWGLVMGTVTRFW